MRSAVAWARLQLRTGESEPKEPEATAAVAPGPRPAWLGPTWPPWWGRDGRRAPCVLCPGEKAGRGLAPAELPCPLTWGSTSGLSPALCCPAQRLGPRLTALTLSRHAGGCQLLSALPVWGRWRRAWACRVLGPSLERSHFLGVPTKAAEGASAPHWGEGGCDHRRRKDPWAQ